MPWFTVSSYERPDRGDSAAVLIEAMIFEAAHGAVAIREGRAHCRLIERGDFALLVGPDGQQLHRYHRSDA
jgi:hypothetical protein